LILFKYFSNLLLIKILILIEWTALANTFKIIVDNYGFHKQLRTDIYVLYVGVDLIHFLIPGIILVDHFAEILD
jgi:hypothetical protein